MNFQMTQHIYIYLSIFEILCYSEIIKLCSPKLFLLKINLFLYIVTHLLRLFSGVLIFTISTNFSFSHQLYTDDVLFKIIGRVLFLFEKLFNNNEPADFFPLKVVTCLNTVYSDCIIFRYYNLQQ